MKDPDGNDMPASLLNDLARKDQSHFVLDAEQWERFVQALDRPVQSKPALERLFKVPGVLDSQNNS